MGKILFAKLKEALFSVLPITLIVFIISFTPLGKNFTVREMAVFGVSAVFLVLGIGLFNLGADLWANMWAQVSQSLKNLKFCFP